jgi:hypothetical protein
VKDRQQKQHLQRQNGKNLSKSADKVANPYVVIRFQRWLVILCAMGTLALSVVLVYGDYRAIQAYKSAQKQVQQDSDPKKMEDIRQQLLKQIDDRLKGFDEVNRQLAEMKTLIAGNPKFLKPDASQVRPAAVRGRADGK